MKTPLGLIFAAIFSIAMLGLTLKSTYVVDEGHVGVITKWGKAVGQEPAEGLKFRNPIITTVKEFDVRERRLAEDMAGATQNQLPIQATITMSWRMDPTRVLEVYKQYGSPERFEADILRPRVRQAAKAGLAKFQASDLIRDRAIAANTIMASVTEALEPYPAILASLQIENVVLPPRYLEAVMAKEEEREAADKEKYKLERQALEAQREVQTAEASRDATIARADGEAYRKRVEAEANADAIRMEGEAQAAAITAQQKAIADNPLVIEYERARRWDGVMPQTILGEQTSMLMSLK